MLLDRSPLGPKPPFDLHTLGTPLAFVLSQDQTLHVILSSPEALTSGEHVSPNTVGNGFGALTDLHREERAILAHTSSTPPRFSEESRRRMGRPYCLFPLFSFQGTGAPLSRGPGPNLAVKRPTEAQIGRKKPLLRLRGSPESG